MNRVKSNYTKDKFRALRIFIIILAIIVSIIVAMICTDCKLVYKFKLSDKIIGYVMNQNIIEKETTDLPQYKLKFISKHAGINDKQVLQTIKSETVTSYNAYPLKLNIKEKTKSTLNTLKLSNTKKYNSNSAKKTISKVSNKSTKKVTTKTTKKTTSKTTKRTTRKTKKVVSKKSKKTTTKKSTTWRLEIPKIGLKATISEGTSQSVLNKYIGHFTETVRKNGNVGLAAHNRGFAVNYFSKLNKLSKNDIIYYTYKGVSQKYKVVYKKIISYTDWSKLHYTNDERITMITCVKNKPHLRLCVQAKRVK